MAHSDLVDLAKIGYLEAAEQGNKMVFCARWQAIDKAQKTVGRDWETVNPPHEGSSAVAVTRI